MKIVYIGDDKRILEKQKVYDVVYTEFSYYLLKVEGISIPYGVLSSIRRMERTTNK